VSPSWYDLLDVAPDASETEIRAAWKSAIGELDPTDRRFRVYNQAAEVLLDPKRRAAYDAELAAAPVEPSAPSATANGSEPAPAGQPTGTRAGAIGAALGRLRRGPRATTDTPATAATADAAAPAATTTPAGTGAGGTGRAVPWVPGWVLAVVAVLTAASVAAAAWMGFTQPSDASVEDSTRAAQSAAERAIGPILSYDYRHLDEDQQAAESYMTSGYRDDYDKVYAVIKQNAPNTHTVVKTDVVASGIVRSGEDRVEVLLFVNRPTTNKQLTQPQVYKDQVRVQMEKVGGDWLVDCMITTPNGHCD
jgi:Mce-associated membrane protein